MGRLSPQSIANFYTKEQIETKITELQDAYDGALRGEYRLDTTAGSQRVAPPDVDQLSKELNTWMKAWEIKTGVNRTMLYRVDYKPTGGPI